jgi:hypothetical protein
MSSTALFYLDNIYQFCLCGANGSTFWLTPEATSCGHLRRDLGLLVSVSNTHTVDLLTSSITQPCFFFYPLFPVFKRERSYPSAPQDVDTKYVHPNVSAHAL